jgi:hypothetical protein
MTDTCPSGATPTEAEDFLAAHPEVEAIDIVLHDSNGIGRGKIIRRHELLPLFRSGRHMPISILGLDICGEDVHETGLIWDQGDGDLRAWPIPGTLKALHNTVPPRAEVLMSLYDLDGQPMTSDPRHALARQVAGVCRGLINKCEPPRTAPWGGWGGGGRSSASSSFWRRFAARRAGPAPPPMCSTAARAARPRSIRSIICTGCCPSSPTSMPGRRKPGSWSRR